MPFAASVYGSRINSHRFPNRRNARAFQAAPEADERPKIAVRGRGFDIAPG